MEFILDFEWVLLRFRLLLVGLKEFDRKSSLPLLENVGLQTPLDSIVCNGGV